MCCARQNKPTKKYLQLSASIVHRWRSIGKYCKFMGHDEVTVSLCGIGWASVGNWNEWDGARTIMLDFVIGADWYGFGAGRR